MECNIHVYLLNQHFSVEHAEAHHDGKESENNLKYDWEDEFKITSKVDAVEELPMQTYPLQGVLDDKPFSYDIPNMRLFQIISEDAPPVFVGCSESILDSCTLTKGEEGYLIQIYLKDYEPMANPIPGLYIAAQEFPKPLVF